MSRTKKIAILAIIAMVLTLMPAALFAADGDKLAGADRIGTAIAIADAGWTTAGTVVLAPADQTNLVDALAAAPLAGQENAPILLTFKGSLNASVKAKIAALGATKVYVVGAIADSVVAEVEAMNGVTAEKLAGANRWATADAINAKLTSPAGTFVVGYNAIADALSVASYAAANKYAIVLTKADGTVDHSKLVGSKTYLVGGTAVVKDHAGATRLSGADRFATNAAVAAGLSFSTDKVYVAGGLNANLVDALAVAPLAAKAKAFVALANGNSVAASITGSEAIAVGGVVTEAARAAVLSGDLAVVSVSAINAKQIQITFNKAVDKDSVTADNLDIWAKADTAGQDRYASATETNIGTAATGYITWNDAKTVATVTLDRLAAVPNPTTVSVKVSKEIKDTSGAKLGTNVTKTAEFNDSTVPYVTSITQTGSKTLEVAFNEAIKDSTDGTDAGVFGTDDFIIDNYAVAITSVAQKSNDNKVVVITTSGDIANGDHVLTVNPSGGDLVDYATFNVVKIEKAFTTNADSAAPSVTAVAKSESKVRLQFNKTVTIPSDDNIEFRYAYNASGAMKVVANTLTSAGGFVTAVANTNGKEYDVTFANPLNPGSATVYIKYLSETGADKDNRIKDLYGNVFANNSAVTFTVSADSTAPAVSAVEYVDETNIDVTYSEEVTGADVATNYTLKDSKGDALQVVSATLKAGTTKTYRVNVASMAKGGAYTLTISSNVKDKSAAANKLVEYTTSFTAADKTKPTVTSMTISTARDRITVQYSETMATSGVYSVLDKNNYRTATVADVQSKLPDGSEITVNGSVVTIKLASALAAGQTKLVVGQVADAAGNLTADLQTSNTMTVSDNFTIAKIDKVKFLDRTKVQFNVDRQLKAITATGIDTTGDVAEATSAQWVNNSDGTATVTAYFPTDSFTTGLTAVTGITVSAGALKDLSDNVNSAKTVQPADIGKVLADWDYIAPTLDTVATVDGDSDGKLDAINVTYSENIYAASVVDSDYTVAGYSVKGVSVSGATVTISVTELATPDTAVKPDVTQVGAVQDTSPQRNELGAQSKKTATDAAGPAIVGAVWDSATSLTVTFSEAISDASMVFGDFTLGGTGAGAVTVNAAASGATANDNTVVLTLSGVPAPGAGQTLTIALSGAGVIADAATVVSTQTAAYTFHTQP